MPTVRRVRSADDRNRSQFLTLPRIGDDFRGYALFTPDPELEDNPGYFEYFDHWDTKETAYVPCSGDSCPYCRVGLRPSTRAKTLWLKDDEIKIFTLNWSMISEFADMLSEDEPVYGQEFLVKRLDDRGKYRIAPKNGKMTKKDLNALVSGDSLPDLEDLVTTQLRRALEDADVASAMEADDDDDDDDQDEAPKARRGKAKKKEPENEIIEDETVTITSVSKKNETIKVEGDNLPEDELLIYTGEDTEEFKRNMEIVISAELDDDGDWVLGAWSAVDEEQEGEEESEEEEEAEGENGDGELPENIEDEEFEIVSVDADEETIDVKNDDLEFTLYFLDEGDAADVDFDEYEDGDTVVISAVQDKEGDMVATTIPEKPKAKRTSAKRSTSKRTSRAKARK